MARVGLLGWDCYGGEQGCPSFLAVLGSRSWGEPSPQTQELFHSTTPGSSSGASALNLWSQRQRKEVNALVLIAGAVAAAAECCP